LCMATGAPSASSADPVSTPAVTAAAAGVSQRLGRLLRTRTDRVYLRSWR